MLRNLLTTGNNRKLKGWEAKVTSPIAIAIFVFQIWALITYDIDPYLQTSIFACSMMGLTFLIRTATKKSGTIDRIPPVDWLFALVCFAITLHIYIKGEWFITRWPEADPLSALDLWFGIAFMVLIIEACRRCVGMAMTGLVALGLIYVMFGHLIPGVLNHRAVDVAMMVDKMMYTSDGVMSSPMKVAATIAFSLVTFGLLFESYGGGKFFNKLASALVGGQTGGPAKATVVAGAFFGMISGSPAADSVTVGSFAVPMMKKAGYTSVFAGGLTALAATGGAVLPPVMSTAAFMMVEFTGIPYLQIALAATIPGILYFVCNLTQVHLYSLRHNYVGSNKEDLPKLAPVIRDNGQFMLPIFLLVYLLIKGYPIVYCGLIAAACTFVISLVKKETRPGLGSIIKSLERVPYVMSSLAVACAAAGVIVGTIMITGIGGKIVSLITMVSGSNVFIALLIAAVICIILGMGMPLISVYILVAVLVVPALMSLGVPVMQAHLFVIYFAALSAITPPVAVAAFAIAPIAEADPLAIGWRACRLGLVVFIVPFIFAFSPALILQGEYNIIYLIWCVISAVIGTTALAVAVEGYLFNVLSVWQRIIVGAGGMLMLVPGLLTDFFGAAVLVLFLAYQLKCVRKKV